MGSVNFMRLSLKRAAHADLSRAAYRKFGASRSFFARCGIPRTSPSSLPMGDRIFYFTALASTTYAVSFKGNRIAQSIIALPFVISTDLSPLCGRSLLEYFSNKASRRPEWYDPSVFRRER